MIIGFSYYDKNYNQQTLHFNDYVISNMTHNVKNTMISIRQLYSNISFHKDIAAVAAVTNIDDYYKSSEVTRFLNDISFSYIFRNNINFFYIYNKKTDCIIAKSGIIDSKLFYDTYFSSNASYEEWKNELLNATGSGNFSPVTFTENSRNYDTIAYNISVPKEPDLSISIIVDRNILFHDVEEIKWTGLCDIFIFDSHGELSLYNSPSNRAIPKYISEVPKENSEIFVSTNHISFDTINMTVVSISPKQMLKKHVLYMRLFAVAIILLSVIIAILMAFRFSKQHYTPVKNILNLFKIADNKNEYSNISNYIKTISSENNHLNSTLRMWHLNCMLKGSPFEEYSIETAEKYDIHFKDGVYGFLIFNIQNFDEFYVDDTSISTEEKYSELKFIMSNIFEELFNTENSAGYVLYTDNLFGCVINIFNTDDKNYDFITEKAQYGLSFIKSHFDLNISYALSDLHDSIQKLPRAYYEALQVISYKNIMNISSSLLYRDIQEPAETSSCFTPDVESNLISCIQLADLENAALIINQIFETIQNDDENLFAQKKYVVYDLAASLLKISSGSSYAIEEILNVFSANSTQIDYNIKNHILNAVSDLCKKNTTFNNQSNHVAKIIKYVYENYSDMSLCVSSIADYFGLTSAYVSKIFKNTYGESLIDFINKYRLTKAKELIETGKYTFNEISNMVGYNHIRTFNRVFKKYEKITPSMYRVQDQQ